MLVVSINLRRSRHRRHFSFHFFDGDEIVTAKGLGNDGADESIVCSRVEKSAVLNGIWKMKKIPPDSLQVAMKTGTEAQKFDI